MARQSIDITGPGPHTISTPGANDRILLREVYITFAQNQPMALRVWFKFGTTLIAGPFYVTDGGEIRYRKTESPNTYQSPMGVGMVIEMDPNLSAAGFIDYEVGSW